MLEHYYEHLEELPKEELVELIRKNDNVIEHLFELFERLDKENFELKVKVRDQKEMIEILTKNKEDEDEEE